MHPARQIWKMRLIHQLGCNPQSQSSRHTIPCGILRMISKYILHAMLSYFIALQCYIGRQILNCLTLTLTRYLHLLLVLLKTVANYSYDRSIAQLLIGGTFHISYHAWHWLCIRCTYTIYYFNRRPFTQAVEDEDQDVSVLSDGPTEIVTCIK